jgi:hypothetical protein
MGGRGEWVTTNNSVPSQRFGVVLSGIELEAENFY